MRLALVHGFTQTGRSWAPLVGGLSAAGYQVVTPDVAGHGAAAGVRADLWAAAAALGAQVGPATWVGYSLGGRLCQHLAVADPGLVGRLVLVSTTAGLDDPAERAARRAEDGALADALEAAGDAGVPAFIERWLAGPLWRTLDGGAADRPARLTNTAAGLAASLRLAGTGNQEPLWDRLAGLAMPVLVVTGALDPKFTALGRRLVAAVGASAEQVVLPGVGHAVPWEAPHAFVTTVTDWLADHPAGA